jgi:hypothetical protein
MDAIRSMHADFYDLPDNTLTRYSASANSSNQKIKLLEEVTIDDSEQSQQTISPILILEGTGTQCINQKALLTSDKKESPDWVTGLEGETVTCEDVTFRLSTSLPILLTATCDKWENGKSISSIDTGHVSIEHGAKTD